MASCQQCCCGDRRFSCMHALWTPAFGGTPSSGITQGDLAVFQQSGILPHKQIKSIETFSLSSEMWLWQMLCWHYSDTTWRLHALSVTSVTYSGSEAHDLTQDKCLSAVSPWNTQEIIEPLSRVNKTQWNIQMGMSDFGFQGTTPVPKGSFHSKCLRRIILGSQKNFSFKVWGTF